MNFHFRRGCDHKCNRWVARKCRPPLSEAAAPLSRAAGGVPRRLTATWPGVSLSVDEEQASFLVLPAELVAALVEGVRCICPFSNQSVVFLLLSMGRTLWVGSSLSGMGRVRRGPALTYRALFRGSSTEQTFRSRILEKEVFRKERNLEKKETKVLVLLESSYPGPIFNMGSISWS